MSHPALRVQLFGSAAIFIGEEPIAGMNSPRLQSLFAYLILHANIPQNRQTLAFLLWSDTTETQARNNLRQAIFQLRQAIPHSEHLLKSDTTTICWMIDDTQSIDTAIFERRLKEADTAAQTGECQDVRSKLEEAVALYHGDLLPSCYDDWITPDRDRMREMFRSACDKLVAMLDEQHDYSAAIEAANRLRQLDPLDEQVYESLIRLHGLNGDRAGARRVYQMAADTLRRELDMEPGEALQTVFDRSQRSIRKPAFSAQAETANNYNLVGRSEEWQQLQTAWQKSAGGGAHLSLIMGEAGIGKSRLAEELYNWVGRQGFTTAYTRSYGVEGSLSLAPITDWLRSRQLRPHLEALDPIWLTEIARLLPEILTEYTFLARPEPISEYGLRQRFFEALARGVLAAPGPLLLWIDDLQWCDQETLEWLHYFLRFQTASSALILGTVRIEESHFDQPLSAMTRQLRADDKVHIIELAPLDAAETAKLAFQVQGHPLDDVSSIRLYQETEGNPLFVVETVRAAMSPPEALQTASLNSSQDTLALPPRVQAIIAGRLAQLSPAARTVAEIGAANGRAFTLDLLLLASRENEETVIEALDELWLRRIVREQSPNVFDFTHDKLREVAYTETSIPQRRLLHRRIAQALVDIHSGMLDPISSQVAAHYEQAGLFDQAIPYYQRAGSVAASVYANEDAIHLYTHGLDLLIKLPASVKRDSVELQIQLALATLYRINKGWASADEERVMNRVIVLADKVGNVEQRIRTMLGVQALYVVQAKYEKVERSHAQAKQLFNQTQEAAPPFADIYLAGAKLCMGQITESREMFDKIVAVRNDQHIWDLQESHGLNYLVHGHAWNSHTLWCLGYPETAMNTAKASIEFAREFAQPFNQSLAITYKTMLDCWTTGTGDLLKYAQEACSLTKEYEAPYYHAWANILLRYAEADLQPEAENINRLSNAINVFLETGARVRLPVFYCMLAQICLKSRRNEEGHEALEKALTESLQNNEHWWDAEIHRLRGELMWAQGADANDVETVLLRAIKISKAQHAKSLELRSAMSLARFRVTNARHQEAKECLLHVYDWFTEGYDTCDLINAKALITSL